MPFNHILLSLLLQLIPLQLSGALSTTSSSSAPYHLPTLFLNSIDDKIYYTNVSFGNPKQHLLLRIDTIQDNSWVMDSEYFITCDERYTNNRTNQTALHLPSVDYNVAVENVCASQGLYNASESDSVHYFTTNYEASNESTNVMYTVSSELNSIEVDGMVLQDEVVFANQTINLSNMNFILANFSNVLAGGLGLAGDGIGNNFMKSLVNNNITSSSSYLLYLGRVSSPDMELHLGGLDTSKLKGDFVEFDFIPYQDIDGNINNNIPIVPLTGLSVTSQGSGVSALVGEADMAIPALFDSRTYYNYLPYDLIIDLALQLNAYYSSDLKRWIVNCEIGNLAATVDFKFGNLTIDISLQELIYFAYDLQGNPLTFQDTGATLCFLSVLPQEDEGFALLGTPFLRSIYLAVDNDGKKLAMGAAYVSLYDDPESLTAYLDSSSIESDDSSGITLVSSSSLPKSDHASVSTSDNKESDSTSSATKSSATKTEDKDADAGLTSKLSFSSLQSQTLTSPASSSSSSSLATSHWGSTKTAILSGYIPFAVPNNITSYETLMLTQSFSNSTRHPSSGNVIVSNGEVVLQTSTGGNGGNNNSTSTSSSDGSTASNLYSSSHAGGSVGQAIGWLNGIVFVFLLII